MRNFLLLSLHPDVVVNKKRRGSRVFEIRSKRISFEKIGSGILAALDLLAVKKISEEELAEIAATKNGESSLQDLYYILAQLRSMGAICYTIQVRKEELVTFVPLSSEQTRNHIDVHNNQRYVLSRFAYLHRDGSSLLLQCPLSHWMAVFQSPTTLQFLMKLKSPYNLKKLQDEFSILGNQRVAALWNFLIQKNFLESAEIENPSLTQWEFHDLLFHAQSRMGRSSVRCGGTYRFENKSNPAEAVKSIVWNDAYKLYKPDIKTLMKTDARLTQVLEERKSIRKSDEDNPITIRQLGEFLYRVARVKKIHRINSRQSFPYEFTTRPYPGAGACYELEIYPIIRYCSGVSAGLYYYDPKGHQLCRVSEVTASVNRFLQDAANANGEWVPQVLLCIAARFSRVSWKYEGMAYAAILKDVGALFQTMYLVGTGMNLACCALGCGDSDLFADSVGTNYYSETSVGEFMLGSNLSK